MNSFIRKTLITSFIADLKFGKEVNMQPQIPEEFKGIMDKIQAVAARTGYKAYAVGGFVRDLVSGASPKDLDILIDGPGNNPAVEFATILDKEGIATHQTILEKERDGHDFGVAKMQIDGQDVELVMPRGESYDPTSRKPTVYKADIKEDAIRRDFTVNTLMMDLADNKVLDPTGKGIEDLKNNVIRSANPDVDSVFVDDPLRMLRAIRFMVTKDMTLDPETEAGIQRNAERLSIISAERITDELKKMLMVANNPSRAVRKLKELGLLKQFLPELEDTEKVMEGGPPYHLEEPTFEHIMRTLDSIPADITARLSALFHDLGKTTTRSEEFKDGVEKAVIHFLGHEDVSAEMAKGILKRLKFPNEEIDKITKIVGKHMVPHQYHKDWKDKSLRRFLVDVGQLISYIFQLAEADRKGSGIDNPSASAQLEEFKQRLEGIQSQPIPVKPVIGGYELMQAFNSPAGPWIKEIHTALVDFQMEKPDLSKDEAWNFVNEYVRLKRPDLAEKQTPGGLTDTQKPV